MDKRLGRSLLALVALPAAATLMWVGCQQGAEQEVTAVAMAAPPAETAPSGPMTLVGEKAPAFAGTSIQGEELNLEDYLGKQVVLLAMWVPTCPSCQQAIPELVDLVKELEGEEPAEAEPESTPADAPEAEGGAEAPESEVDAESAAAPELADFTFLTVYLGEDVEAPTRYLEERDFDFPVIPDKGGTIKELYQVAVTPHIVLIGADGTVQGVIQGWGSTHRSTVADQLQRVRAGEDITGAAVTAPVGGG